MDAALKILAPSQDGLPQLIRRAIFRTTQRSQDLSQNLTK